MKPNTLNFLKPILGVPHFRRAELPNRSGTCVSAKHHSDLPDLFNTHFVIGRLLCCLMFRVQASNTPTFTPSSVLFRHPNNTAAKVAFTFITFTSTQPHLIKPSGKPHTQRSRAQTHLKVNAGSSIRCTTVPMTTQRNP